MRGINKVHLLGIVGRDIDVITTRTGLSVANISLATSSKTKDKVTNETKEKTTWHNVVAFGKMADIMGQYVKKGSKLYVEGSIDYQEFEKDGVKKNITKINVIDFSIVSSSHHTEQQKSSNVIASPKASSTLYKAFEDDDLIPF